MTRIPSGIEPSSAMNVGVWRPPEPRSASTVPNRKYKPGTPLAK